MDPTGINMIISAEARTSALLDMLSLYLGQAADGGDTLPTEKLSALVWQAQLNLGELRDGITECSAAMNLVNDGDRQWKTTA
ncbi:MAG: hypothetical protein ACTMHG_05360 [Marinobacter sp.]